MRIPAKIIYRFNMMPFRIPDAFFVEIDKQIEISRDPE